MHSLIVCGWAERDQKTTESDLLDEMDAELGCDPVCLWNAFIALKQVRSAGDGAVVRIKKTN